MQARQRGSLHAGALARCDTWKWRGVYVQVRDSDVAEKCRLDNIADQKTFCNLAEMVLVFGLPHILSIVPPAIFELMKAVPLQLFWQDCRHIHQLLVPFDQDFSCLAPLRQALAMTSLTAVEARDVFSSLKMPDPPLVSVPALRICVGQTFHSRPHHKRDGSSRHWNSPMSSSMFFMMAWSTIGANRDNSCETACAQI